MKTRSIIVFLFWACALLAAPELIGKEKKEKEKEEKVLTEYEKIFDKKKNVKTREGMMKLHLFDTKIIAEIPEDILGRPMAMWNVVEKTSDPQMISIDKTLGSTLRLTFTRTDSLVNVRIMTPHIITEDDNIREAMQSSSIGPIIASFPIKTFSPDSTASVCDLTELFTMESEKLHKLTKVIGIFLISFDYQKGKSFIKDIEVYDDRIETLVSKNYKSGDAQYTTEARFVMTMLPDDVMEARKADTRVGTVRVQTDEYISNLGSRQEYYACRRRLAPEQAPVVFHVDTLFSPVWQKGIMDGVEKWNKAFERIGIKNALKAVPYPKNDTTFNSSNSKLNCIKYNQTDSRAMSPRLVIDPRSGEIIASTISVGRDLEFMEMTTDAMIEMGAYNPAVRGIRLPEKELYDAVVSYTMRAVGRCLGLAENYAAASVYSVEQLRDPEFTQTYGFASSVMTPLPYNYLLQKEDFERGASPVMQDLGPYDYYAIEWLYSKESIDVITDNPVYKYADRNSLDASHYLYSLSSDQKTASELALKNIKYVAENAAEWVYVPGVDESFACLIPDFIFLTARKYIIPMVKKIGSYTTEDSRSAEKNGTITYKALPLEEQKEAIKWVLDQTTDMTWIDNEGLLKLSELNDNLSSMLEGYISPTAIAALISKTTTLDAPVSEIDNLQKELLEYTASLIFPKVSKAKTLTHGEFIQFRWFVSILQSSKTNKAICYKLLQDARKVAESGSAKNKNQEHRDALRFIADSI